MHGTPFRRRHRSARASAGAAASGAAAARAAAASAPRRPPVDRAEVAGWFAGRLPDGWFTGPAELTIDRDEITVVGTLAEPEAGEGDPAAARAGRIARFREETREQRMAIADAAQERYGRSVAWGAACGDDREVFTNAVGAGDDPAAAARAAGARHPGRRRGGPVPLRGAGVGGPAGRPARRRVAGRAARRRWPRSRRSAAAAPRCEPSFPAIMEPAGRHAVRGRRVATRAP